jgi:hypothetical protein
MIYQHWDFECHGIDDMIQYRIYLICWSVSVVVVCQSVEGKMSEAKSRQVESHLNAILESDRVRFVEGQAMALSPSPISIRYDSDVHAFTPVVWLRDCGFYGKALPYKAYNESRTYIGR